MRALGRSLLLLLLLSVGEALGFQCLPLPKAGLSRFGGGREMGRMRLAMSYDDDISDPYKVYLNTGKPKKKDKSVTEDMQEVPEEQRPYQEFVALMEAPFFNWAQQKRVLITNLATAYGIALLVSFPISATTFSPQDLPLEWLLASNVGGLGVLVLLTARLYAGWSYIGERLTQPVVGFEKTGWFDGANFKKPDFVMERDLTVFEAEVEPALKALKTVLLVALFGFALTFVAYKFAVPVDPYQNITDEYLFGLRGDTDAANLEAAQQLQRTGQPTYCLDRYYRALAGGQGCD